MLPKIIITTFAFFVVVGGLSLFEGTLRPPAKFETVAVSPEARKSWGTKKWEYWIATPSIRNDIQTPQMITLFTLPF